MKPALPALPRLRTAVGIACVVLATAASIAAQFIPRSIEELTAEATCVVHGRVEAVEVLPGSDGAPFTRVELAVESTWKGSSTHRIVVTQAGGTLGSRRVVVSGEATYLPGEEVVVFLVANPRGEWLTCGMTQGKFSVRREESQVWVAHPFIGGSPKPGGFRPAHLLPLSLADLHKRVTAVKP